MDYLQINTDQELQRYCEQLASEPIIAFDTEFVAEHTYRPQLCLIQIAAGNSQAIIDTLSVQDLRPFWELLATGNHCTLVHAGREELGFSLSAIGKVPSRIFDIQIAAGLVGLEYPASYRSLSKKLLKYNPTKEETRTDWRHRPLSQRQLEYAIDDVLYLKKMHQKLDARLIELQRKPWLDDEMNRWIKQVCFAHKRQRWRRVSGIGGLSARSKAIVRELWFWREGAAEKKNIPVRRVLRDDLIVELAKRQSSDRTRIAALRGMDRNDLQRALPDLSACVERALQLPTDKLPTSRHPRDLPPQINMLGQLISSALNSICRQTNLAPSMVGNPSDVRDLIAFRLGCLKEDDEPPILSQGWRAEVIGSLIDNLLSGKLAVRINDPHSEHPLTLESAD